MTDHDPREELKEITRLVRHLVDREQWRGTADLLAATVTRATPRAAEAPRGAAIPAASRVADAPRVAAIAALPRVAAAPPAAPAGAAVAVAEPVALPDDWEPVARNGRRAPQTPAPAAAPLPVAAAPPDRNLFGEAPPRPATAAFEAAVRPAPLPPFHPPLAPGGAGRAAVVSASLAVLDQVAAAVRGCEKCGLCRTRTRAVPGTGSARSGIVFVGEAPGADEDAQGEPFVGRAGQLLTAMIKAMDDKNLIPGVRLDRSTVYIANVLKCRPPENRNPLPHEIEQCSPHLLRQLDALEPRMICCLGKFSAELLTGLRSSSLTAMRGKTYRYKGAKLIVTYHPAALLRNPNWKKPAWEDLQRLAAEYQTD